MSLYISRHPLARFEVITIPLLAAMRIYTRLRVEGTQNIPTTGAFVLAANHSSHADTPAIFAAMPHALRKHFVAAAAQDYFFDRGLKQFFTRVLFNIIPVARNAPAGEDALRHVIRALREEYGVLLYPEGTRSESGELGPFRSGIGRLVALFPGLPVVPVWVAGSVRVLPKGALIPRPYPVRVSFGSPLRHLRADPDDPATWKVVANEVREAVISLSLQRRSPN